MAHIDYLVVMSYLAKGIIIAYTPIINYKTDYNSSLKRLVWFVKWEKVDNRDLKNQK